MIRRLKFWGRAVEPELTDREKFMRAMNAAAKQAMMTNNEIRHILGYTEALNSMLSDDLRRIADKADLNAHEWKSIVEYENKIYAERFHGRMFVLDKANQVRSELGLPLVPSLVRLNQKENS